MNYSDWDDDALLEEERYLWERVHPPTNESPRWKEAWREIAREVKARHLEDKLDWSQKA